MTEPLDVVYAYKHTNSDELEWSIKSLKNVEPRNVYVIGDDPKIDGVKYIQPDKQHWGGYSKYHNQMQNYLTACNHKRISANFLSANDDFFILRPWKPVNYNRGSLKEHIKRRRINDLYARSLNETRKYLEARNFPTLSFELHTPFLFNKMLFKQLITTLEPTIRTRLQIRSLYGNIYGVPTEYREDVKNPKDLDSITDLRLVSSSNGSWNREFGDFIRKELA